MTPRRMVFLPRMFQLADGQRVRVTCVALAALTLMQGAFASRATAIPLDQLFKHSNQDVTVDSSANQEDLIPVDVPVMVEGHITKITKRCTKCDLATKRELNSEMSHYKNELRNNDDAERRENLLNRKEVDRIEKSTLEQEDKDVMLADEKERHENKLDEIKRERALIEEEHVQNQSRILKFHGINPSDLADVNKIIAPKPVAQPTY